MPPGYVETSSDIARELVERGVEDPKRFVPNAELTVERERIVIRDEEQRVAESFQLTRVSDPTAFKSRQGQTLNF